MANEMTVQKTESLSNSEAFTNKVLKEFGSNVAGNIQVTDYQRQLIQGYFIATDRALKMAEEKRVSKNENNKDHKWDNPDPINWNTVDLNALALDVVHYARMGLDMMQDNHLSAIPFKDNNRLSRTGTKMYVVNLMPGYNGIQYIAEKYALEKPVSVTVAEPINIIYQTAEDGLADTVKPRLELAGADCEKIMVIDESDKSLSMIDERLEEAIVKTGARLLILDPIQAYLGGGMDMNRANEARDMTKKLGALAEKTKCAIILIGHMNKAAGNKVAYRGMGSIDFFAVARSVLLVGRIEGEANTRAVVQIKNNLAAFGHAKAFELSESGFQWLGDYEITVDEVLGGIAPKANKMEQAKKILRELAETQNAVQSNEVFELAEEHGISKRTMENAKKELGIKAKKINNAWYWELDKIGL